MTLLDSIASRVKERRKTSGLAEPFASPARKSVTNISRSCKKQHQNQNQYYSAEREYKSGQWGHHNAGRVLGIVSHPSQKHLSGYIWRWKNTNPHRSLSLPEKASQHCTPMFLDILPFLPSAPEIEMENRGSDIPSLIEQILQTPLVAASPLPTNVDLGEEDALGTVRYYWYPPSATSGSGTTLLATKTRSSLLQARAHPATLAVVAWIDNLLDTPRLHVPSNVPRLKGLHNVATN